MALTVSHGYNSILAVGKEGTLGTPVVVTQKVPFRSETLTANVNQISDNDLCGSPVRGPSQDGTLIVEGGWTQSMRPTLQQVPLECFFGNLLLDTPVVGTNTYSMLNTTSGLGMTVAINKDVSPIWEFAGFKPSEMTISGNPTDGILIAFTGVATGLDLSSAINTLPILQGLAVPSNFFIFQNMTFRIADLVDPLAAADAVQISDFSFTFNRNLEATEVNSANRLEGEENDFRDATGSITVPRYCEDFLVDAHLNGTLLQMDTSWTNGTNTKTVQMPLVKVTSATASVGGAEFTTLDVELEFFKDPSGTNPHITLQNPQAEFEMTEN